MLVFLGILVASFAVALRLGTRSQQLALSELGESLVRSSDLGTKAFIKLAFAHAGRLLQN